MVHDVIGNSVARLLSRRLWSAGLLIVAGLMAAPYRAQAQNLVQDPNFTNGFNAYFNVCCNVTTMPTENGTVAVLPGGSTFSQMIPTSPATLYLVSFLASFTGPGTYTATFGDTTFNEDPAKPGIFSFSAPAFGSNTTLTFATGDNNNTEYLSNLDVQPASAPVPVPGAGILSFCAMFVALAVRRMRRRVAPYAAVAPSGSEIRLLN